MGVKTLFMPPWISKRFVFFIWMVPNEPCMIDRESDGQGTPVSIKIHQGLKTLDFGLAMITVDMPVQFGLWCWFVCKHVFFYVNIYLFFKIILSSISAKVNLLKADLPWIWETTCPISQTTKHPNPQVHHSLTSYTSIHKQNDLWCILIQNSYPNFPTCHNV